MWEKECGKEISELFLLCTEEEKNSVCRKKEKEALRNLTTERKCRRKKESRGIDDNVILSEEELFYWSK